MYKMNTWNCELDMSLFEYLYDLGVGGKFIYLFICLNCCHVRNQFCVVISAS